MEDAEETQKSDDASETSLDELLAKRGEGDEEDEAGPLLVTDREPSERLPGKVAPKRATEFVCKKCFLIKHRSQLADRRRGYCRDCV